MFMLQSIIVGMQIGLLSLTWGEWSSVFVGACLGLCAVNAIKAGRREFASA